MDVEVQPERLPEQLGKPCSLELTLLCLSRYSAL